jgi:hypothetical protein
MTSGCKRQSRLPIHVLDTLQPKGMDFGQGKTVNLKTIVLSERNQTKMRKCYFTSFIQKSRKYKPVHTNRSRAHGLTNVFTSLAYDAFMAVHFMCI